MPCHPSLVTVTLTTAWEHRPLSGRVMPKMGPQFHFWRRPAASISASSNPFRRRLAVLRLDQATLRRVLMVGKSQRIGGSAISTTVPLLLSLVPLSIDVKFGQLNREISFGIPDTVNRCCPCSLGQVHNCTFQTAKYYLRFQLVRSTDWCHQDRWCSICPVVCWGRRLCLSNQGRID